MKTEAMSSEDLWSNPEMLEVSCLPVIGNCQISSILSFDASDKLETHELSNDTSIDSNEQNYVVLKDEGASKSSENKKSTPNNFEDMLYFVCNLCPFLCTNNTKINEHIEMAHKNKTVRKLAHLKCPACANVFFHKMSLRSHLIHDHGVGNSDINKITQAVVYYANKAKSADEQNKKNAKTDTKLVNSLKTEQIPPKTLLHTNNTKKLAIVTNTKQNNPIAKVIEKVKLHRCDLSPCKVTMQSLDKINYHISCHKDSGFVCLLCDDFFGYWKSLASHLWRLHKVDMELYSCSECDYKSVSLSKLNNIHKLIHGDVRAYACDICSKAFKNSKQLGNHKITHKNDTEKRFACGLCFKSCSDRRQLRIHMNVVHEKLKPFLCNFCKYRASTQSSLKMHIRQHTGEKPFLCDVCTYSTADHNSLRRHKLRHTGQKPYKCLYCSYACIQSSTYKVHLKTKHPGQEKDLMFTCQECQFRSVNKEMFVSHMVTMHDQKPSA